jgi:hypothetical protein
LARLDIYVRLECQLQNRLDGVADKKLSIEDQKLANSKAIVDQTDNPTDE